MLAESEGDTAMVKIEQPGKPDKIESYVRVEGKWIPRSLADDCETVIARIV